MSYMILFPYYRQETGKNRFRNSPKTTREESKTSDSNQVDLPDPKINVLNHYGQLLFLVRMVTQP